MPDWLRHAISSLEHYPWLKPVVMMLSALLLIVVLGGSFAYRELLRLQLAPLETRQAELVSQTIASISRELGHIRNLTHVLKNSLRVQRALQVDQPPQLTQLGEDFIRFSQASPVISQLRWLDRNGNERVRVNIRNGHAQIVSQDALQNKATYYYFRQALRTPADRVYTSPIDLNVEQGRIVIPFQPTLRATILTGEKDGLQPGVLIINFNLAPFFERLRALADNNTHVELLDPSGYWLLHPDRQQEWGFQLGHPELTLAETASPLWTALHAAHFAGSLRYQQRLVSFARLNHDESSDRAGTAEDHLFVMAVSRSGQINELRYRLLLPIILVCSAIFAVGLILIRYFVRGVQERHRLILALQHEKDLLERAYAELTHSHQRLQLLQDELVESRKLASLGMMVAGVAHELNTPTGGALMTISTLQTQLANLATAVTQGMTRSQLEGYLQYTDEGLKLAASNLRHAADLINSFKRLAIDRSQEQVVHFNLADPIHDLANSLRPRLKQTSITLKTVLPERIEMQGYPGILSQVLQNLVDNALNHAFTPNQPGSIVITAVFTGAADTVILSVSDNGQGIEPDLRDTLFDPFVSSGRSRGHIGLGLHLVHQWVYQVLQGTLRVESTPRTGTVFTLILPVRISPASPVTEATTKHQ